MREQRFNLIFAPSTSARVPGGIYTLSRSGVPTRELFLSSFGASAPPLLQALVNRSS